MLNKKIKLLICLIVCVWATMNYFPASNCTYPACKYNKDYAVADAWKTPFLINRNG